MESTARTLAFALSLSMLALISCGENRSHRNLEIEGEIVQVDSEDAGMNAAMQEARDHFGEFWEEIQADRRRPIPVLGPAMVKAYFTDSGQEDGEHMWVDEVAFDGKQTISGVLSSTPGHLTSVKNGDQVSFPLERLSDWLYVSEGKAVGAYTVNYIRMGLGEKERAEHDASYPFSFE